MHRHHWNLSAYLLSPLFFLILLHLLFMKLHHLHLLPSLLQEQHPLPFVHFLYLPLLLTFPLFLLCQDQSLLLLSAQLQPQTMLRIQPILIPLIPMMHILPLFLLVLVWLVPVVELLTNHFPLLLLTFLISIIHNLKAVFLIFTHKDLLLRCILRTAKIHQIVIHLHQFLKPSKYIL